MKSEIDLSIVVPVYNSAETLPKLVERLSHLPVDGAYELILVNDGSHDNSAEVCRQLTGTAEFPVTFVNLSRNFGEHNAVMAGLHQARGKYIINIDDDFQNPPEEVVRVYEYARSGNYDVVYTRYPERCHSLWRVFGSRLTNKMADVLLDKPKGLYLSSFRCMNAFIASHILEYKGSFPYIDGMIMQMTQNIGVIEVAHSERQNGDSGYTLRTLLHLWGSVFTNFSVLPLRLAFGLGIFLTVTAFIGIIFVIVDHALYGTPAGWGATMFPLILLRGIQMLLTGVIGEYVGRMYLNSNKRPQFVVRDVVTSKDSALFSGSRSKENSETSS